MRGQPAALRLMGVAAMSVRVWGYPAAGCRAPEAPTASAIRAPRSPRTELPASHPTRVSSFSSGHCAQVPHSPLLCAPTLVCRCPSPDSPPPHTHNSPRAPLAGQQSPGLGGRPHLFMLHQVSNGTLLQYFCLEKKSHGWRSLVACSPWGGYKSDMTERLHFRFSLSCIGEGNCNPLQCSCLENPRDQGAWWAPIWGCTESDTTEVT